MSGLFRRRRRDREVAATRPRALAAVEPELAVAPPRPAVWSWTRDRPRFVEPLRDWAAHKAWVVHVDETRDAEGPDYAVWLAYEERGRVVQLHRVFGFDAVHWALGSPDHAAWWGRVIAPGRPVTVLVGPGVSLKKNWILYGETEAFVEEDGALVWAADRSG